MNVLYTSQKLQELFCDSEDHHPIHANASGDGDVVPGRCCRLCGGDNNLRYFGDTYVWEGVEERYDQLLSDCFGVKVSPSDCMICEWCVRALRTTDRFRALVHSAFDLPISDFSSSHATLKSCSCINNDNNDVQLSTMSEETSEASEEEVKEEIPPKKPFELAKKREDRRRLGVDAEKALKRINIPCDVCGRRYPMLAPSEGYKAFTCSRCKKNGELRGSVCKKCNIMMPASMMQEHLDLHTKADMRGKSREEERKRVHYQPKTTNLFVENAMTKARIPKYQCTKCPKKYALARHLVMHIRNSHGDSSDNCCTFCGQYMETKEMLQEHLLEHSSLQQCAECLLVFRNKRALATHSCKHHVCSGTSIK